MIYATKGAAVGRKDDTKATTDLDSHANMMVVGKQATIIQYSGRTVEVNPFADVCKKVENVPIVDAAIAYDCPYTMKTYILIMRNALYVPTMKHNLIPPFILREAGLVVNDVPRIHCGEGVTRESHSIVVENPSLLIPLRLDGIFSQFVTRGLTKEEQLECDCYEHVMLTPDSKEWNPYDESYADNEESFIDWRGELQESVPRKRRLMFDDADVCDINVSSERFEAAIDAVISGNDVTFVTDHSQESQDTSVLNEEDPICAQVCDLSACFDENQMKQMMDSKLQSRSLEWLLVLPLLAAPKMIWTVNYSNPISQRRMLRSPKVYQRSCYRKSGVYRKTKLEEHSKLPPN